MKGFGFLALIPCSLDCVYQDDGMCNMNMPSLISLQSDKCPHYICKKAQESSCAEYDDDSILLPPRTPF